MVVGFKTITVEDATEAIIDYRGKTPPKTDSGVQLITAKVIKGGRILGEPKEFIAADYYDEWMRRGLPQRLDVLITTEAPLGEVAILRDREKIALAQRVILLRARRGKVDPEFLFYALQSEFGQGELHARATGTTVAGIKQSELRRVRLPIFELPVQRRIAGILSAYDELIENCQRRIRILEEMARALYREWFVHFRFPDHETVPRIDSSLGPIPKGWEAKRLDSVCDSINDGDWIETKDQGGGDYRLVQISNIGVGEFIETGNYRYITQETFERLRCNEIVTGDILVARMPTPIGRAWLATKMPWRMITAVDVAIIRTLREALDPLFLARAWNEPSNLQRILTQASGTTRLRVTRRELSALEFVIPPIDVQSRFSTLIAANARLIETLRSQAENLRRTRDLLLPRLLSGQVSLDVSAFEDVAEPTAPAPPLSQTDLASEEPALRAAEETPPYPVAGAELIRRKTV
jgi:type I restriction enzyme S subunit